MFLGILELLFIDSKPKLRRHEPCEVDGESVRVIQPPYVCTIELIDTQIFRTCRVLVKELLAPIKGT